MSGIYGAWNPFLKNVDAKDLKWLKSWNLAYGRNVDDVSVGESLYLGCAQEKYSEKRSQTKPVLVKNGKYAILDVLLYNREELVEEGAFSESLADEELLLMYVEKFGPEKLKDVNGDFAGVIFDKKKNTCILFRDHMGVRPLYYYMNEKSLVFSTDIRGLVSMEAVEISVNEKWLWHNLAGTVYAGTENTEFANIFCVQPGTYTVFSLEELGIRKVKKVYWQPGRKKIRLSSKKAYIERMRDLITDSVKRRLDAVSGPVGAELSGGLDSGIIGILIHRMGREAFYFSWSASPEEIPYAENDERFVIQDICEQEDITCHYMGQVLRFRDDCNINQKMNAIGISPNKLAGVSRRYILPPHMNTFQITQASQYVSECGAGVVFTGHGGDEGVSHRSNPYELFFHKEYFRYFQYMWDSTSGLKHRIYKTLIRSYKNLFVIGKELRSPFLNVYAAKDMLKKEFSEKYQSERGALCTYAYDPCTYVKEGGSRNRLDVVALLGAYCGARYLIPYLDYRVIDYALSIPRHLYLKENINRYIFREAFKDIMPESLYRLTGKEDTSWKNAEKKANGEQEEKAYMEKKQRLFSMLDKERWEDYLDWEVLGQWVSTPHSEVEEVQDAAMFLGINCCLSFQNLVTLSRSVKTDI